MILEMKQLIEERAAAREDRRNLMKNVNILDDTLDRIGKELREVCDHTYGNGESAYIDAVYYVCDICGNIV